MLGKAGWRNSQRQRTHKTEGVVSSTWVCELHIANSLRGQPSTRTEGRARLHSMTECRRRWCFLKPPLRIRKKLRPSSCGLGFAFLTDRRMALRLVGHWIRGRQQPVS
jgi:hypothetical protein